MPVLVLAAEPTVGFSPSQMKASVGETVTVDIIMQDFPASEGGGITIRFNPAVVKVITVAVDDASWSFTGSDGVIDNEGGSVSDILFSSFTGVSGTATIATVQFQAIKSGKSRLRIKPSSLNPFASAGEPIKVEFNRGKIKVGRGGGKKGRS